MSLHAFQNQQGKRKKDIVNLYREIAKEKSSEMPTIEKPEIKKARTNEEKLKELFGEVKVK